MKKSFFDSIAEWFYPKKALLLSDDVNGVNLGVPVIREIGIEPVVFQNYEEFLSKMHSKKNFSYNVAFVFKNGSTTKAESITRFIQQTDPNIKTIIFDSARDLRQKLSLSII